MKYSSSIVLVAIAFVIGLFNVNIADAMTLRGGCGSDLNESACIAYPGCSWCSCRALPSRCWTTAQAAKLPEAVYVCSNSSNPICATLPISECNNQSTGNQATGCFNCNNKCVNYEAASAYPSGQCTGPF